MDGKYIFGDEHVVGYTEVLTEIECSTHETQCYKSILTQFKKLKNKLKIFKLKDKFKGLPWQSSG